MHHRLPLALLLLLAATPAVAQEPVSFAGKTVRIVVGFPPGGGADLYGRLVQRHIERHLPGTPSVITQNMPGAGTLRAVQSIAASPEDGTVIVNFSSSLVTESILSPERVKVDFRAFSFIGNVADDSRVCFVRAALGIRTWDALAAREGVIFGGTAAGTSGNLDVAILRNLFRLRLRLVQGYAGAADKRLALEKGEIDGDCGGATSLPPDWLRDGKVDVVVKHSAGQLPGIGGDVPFGGTLLKDGADRRVYDFLITPQTLGRLFIVSSKVPPERLAVLRRAFDATMADPAFRAEAVKLGVQVAPTGGAEVDRRIAALYATPAELVARARAIASE